MKKCVIFCSADCSALLEPTQPEDYIIAADGGLRHTGRFGLTPHVTLGDFDSLGYVPEQAEVHPVKKDDTDAMLAVRHGLDLGYEEFWLYGCLDGPRLDHTLANFQLLQFLADRGARGYLIGETYIATVISKELLRFPASSTGILSLFCLGPDARGVTLKNLQYPMENGCLTCGFPLGVSNHFVGKQASVRVAEGSILALWDRANGLAAERG